VYVDKIDIQNFRTFADVHVEFVHPDINAASLGLPAPKINNVNLILGGNGSGKTNQQPGWQKPYRAFSRFGSRTTWNLS
jgi:predicted ATPase